MIALKLFKILEFDTNISKILKIQIRNFLISKLNNRQINVCFFSLKEAFNYFSAKHLTTKFFKITKNSQFLLY